MKHNHHLMLARNSIKPFLEDISKDAPIGLGCSGGADSLAILAGLATLYKGQRSQQVHVVIVDHQLQAVTAEVAKTTAAIAQSYGFIPHVVKISIDEGQGGPEAAARTARYAAFEEIIASNNIQKFFLAHTMSDQAEQVILGLLRGSGNRSLAGIPEERNVYARPFLNSLSRSDTEKVCAEANLDFWVDPHNDCDDYQRVVARKFLKNMSDEYSRDFVPALARSAQINAEDSDALDFYAAQEWEKVEASGWSANTLMKLPKSIRMKLYARKVREQDVPSDAVTFELLQRIDALVVDWKGQGSIHLPAGHTVSRKDEIIFGRS